MFPGLRSVIWVGRESSMTGVSPDINGPHVFSFQQLFFLDSTMETWGRLLRLGLILLLSIPFSEAQSCQANMPGLPGVPGIPGPDGNDGVDGEKGDVGEDNPSNQEKG